MRAKLAVLAFCLFLMPVETVAQSEPLCLVVGRFESHDAASNVSAMVSERGFNASTFKYVDSLGSTSWIVQVGPYSTAELAMSARIDVARKVKIELNNYPAIIQCDTGEVVPAIRR